MRVRTINFRMTVNALSDSSSIEYSPVTGVIRSAVLHFPPGVNALCEVFIYHKTKQILPEGRTGITLDDATQTFDINEPVVENDPIKVRVINHDDTWEHTIAVIVIIEEQNG